MKAISFKTMTLCDNDEWYMKKAMRRYFINSTEQIVLTGESMLEFYKYLRENLEASEDFIYMQWGYFPIRIWQIKDMKYYGQDAKNHPEDKETRSWIEYYLKDNYKYYFNELISPVVMNVGKLLEIMDRFPDSVPVKNWPQTMYGNLCDVKPKTQTFYNYSVNKLSLDAEIKNSIAWNGEYGILHPNNPPCGLLKAELDRNLSYANS